MPASLNLSEHVIETVEGEGWTKRRHDRDPELEIRVVVCEAWVNPVRLSFNASDAGDMNDRDGFAHEVADYVMAAPLGTAAGDTSRTATGSVRRTPVA